MPRNFPNWLQAYMQYTSDSESPDDFHFWTGVSTVAGALRRRVWIDMRKWQWTPNFYIILVGPPGIAAKSTSMRTGAKLLYDVPNIHFGPSSTTWQALTTAFEASMEHLKIPAANEDGSDRFVPMSCLTTHVSELGTFLKPDDQGLMDLLVDLWDGQQVKWSHSTKTTGNTEIINPWLNVIGCTTPTWMQQNIPQQSIGGGLMSRIIFVFGDKKRELIPYPDEVMKLHNYDQLQRALLDDLLQIAELNGECELTASARDWGRAWYTKHWSERPEHMASDRYEGYLARKQTHLHKLAIIMSVVRSDDLRVTDAHLIEASALLTSTEQHMFRAFESIGVVDESRHVAAIGAYLRAYKTPLSPDQLFSLVGSTMDLRAFEGAVKAGVTGGIFRVVIYNGAKCLTVKEASNG